MQESSRKTEIISAMTFKKWCWNSKYVETLYVDLCNFVTKKEWENITAMTSTTGPFLLIVGLRKTQN